MLAGAEIIEMWGDLLLEQTHEQQERFNAQGAAVAQWVKDMQANPYAPRLNPAQRFLDWENLPAVSRDLARYLTDWNQCAWAWGYAWVALWEEEARLALTLRRAK